MKIILREIIGDNDPDSRPRLLSFKEFCQYVYEPSQRKRSLNRLEDEENELRKTIGSQSPVAIAKHTRQENLKPRIKGVELRK